VFAPSRSRARATAALSLDRACGFSAKLFEQSKCCDAAAASAHAARRRRPAMAKNEAKDGLEKVRRAPRARNRRRADAKVA